ncbi:MAG: hypothetical protein O7E52_29850 [Candidatus Poribacteria bacterium]|nr:hypothetical protein [Candidatus Poribacteria bacterium]
MSLENWVLSISTFKRAVLKITDNLLARVNLETIEDEKGVVGAKAVWVGERSTSTLEVNAPSLKGSITTDSDTAPTIEYWHKGDKRGFAFRNPKSISCEFDEKTLKKIVTGKAAGIAAVAGAAAGLLGWFALVVASRAALVRSEAEVSSPPLLESDAVLTDSGDDAAV